MGAGYCRQSRALGHARGRGHGSGRIAALHGDQDRRQGDHPGERTTGQKQPGDQALASGGVGIRIASHTMRDCTAAPDICNLPWMHLKFRAEEHLPQRAQK
jgi:hypothetical protein